MPVLNRTSSSTKRRVSPAAVQHRSVKSDGGGGGGGDEEVVFDEEGGRWIGQRCGWKVEGALVERRCLIQVSCMSCAWCKRLIPVKLTSSTPEADGGLDVSLGQIFVSALHLMGLNQFKSFSQQSHGTEIEVVCNDHYSGCVESVHNRVPSCCYVHSAQVIMRSAHNFAPFPV